MDKNRAMLFGNGGNERVRQRQARASRGSQVHGGIGGFAWERRSRRQLLVRGGSARGWQACRERLRSQAALAFGVRLGALLHEVADGISARLQVGEASPIRLEAMTA
jgi:hypothetical protein